MPNDPHQLNSVPADAADQPAAAGTAAYTKPANEAGVEDPGYKREGPGSRIGPYKLLQEIGEGGMGTVFMAEQQEPVRRMVALKVIKLGMDSKEVLARFEAERQALALMDHPNIAKVLDSGTTDSGRPYFGMELVKGIPITKYCDEHQLTPRERLMLFVPVCQAIQHAHQKGVIHRDIKPSNVLVASYDGKPVPKVIDFGVAKAMGQKLTERTMFTAMGHIIGTFEYMSPEQAELNALDIDTRSDIYSLGVLLYQLLTGSTPLSRKRLKEASLQEAMRLIREEEPPKPSTRLSSSESLPSISAQRKMEPAKLTKMMRGELDWIVMKALEKDRSRRYETANGFARDIERFLHDEPVEACPPSAGYRIRKLARKYRTPLRVAALCLLLLVGGVVVSAWQAVRATQEAVRATQAEEVATAERDRAVRAENDALANEQLAKAQENKAKASELHALEQEKEARTVLEFFLDKILAAARPEGQEGGLGIDVSIRTAIDEVEPQIAKAFHDKPLIEASIRNTLGMTYFYLGDYQLAILQHSRALALRKAKLGPDHADTLTSMDNLGLTYRTAGQGDAAVLVLQEVLKLRQAKLGLDHSDTLTNMNELAWGYRSAERRLEATALREELVKLRTVKLGDDHPDTLRTMAHLGTDYRDLGRFNAAVPLLEKAFEVFKGKIGVDHIHTRQIMQNLAFAYQVAGRFDDAVLLFGDSLKLRKTQLGAGHPESLEGMDYLAKAYHAAGRLKEALALHEETLTLRKAKLGPDHPATLASMNNLAAAYRAAGRIQDALALHEETLRLRKAKLGPDHRDTFLSMNNVALAYRDSGQLKEAVQLFEETLKLRKAKLGPDHPDTVVSMNNLASAYQPAGRLPEAITLLEETLRLATAKLGPDHPQTLNSMVLLAVVYEDADRLKDAFPLYEGVWKLRKANLSPDFPATLDAMNGVARAYRDGGRLAEALTLYAETLKLTKAKLGPNHNLTLTNMTGLGDTLARMKKYAEAEPILRECLTLREQKEPDSWKTFHAKSVLGATLLGQQKYAEAEPLLLAGYKGLKQNENLLRSTDSQRVIDALERLVQLYEETGPPEQLAKWRKELETAKGKGKIQK